MTLRTAFEAYDTSKDGVITYEEFQQALHASGLSDKELSDIFASIVSAVVRSLLLQSRVKNR